MNSQLKRLPFVTKTTLVLSLATFTARGADYEWKGGAGTPPDANGYSYSANWVTSSCSNGVPGIGDVIYVNLGGTTSCGSATGWCIQDSTSTRTVYYMELCGANPVKMRLQLRDGAMSVSSQTILLDNAYIDAAKNFTSANTEWEDDVWIEPGDGALVDLGTIHTLGVSNLSSIITATLHLNDNNTGQLVGDILHIDGQNLSGQRGFRMDGYGSTFTLTECLELITGDGSTHHKVKLWVDHGSLIINDPGSLVARLKINGGDAANRSAIVDVDDVLTAEETWIYPGYADIDVESGKTFKAGTELLIQQGAYVTKTGEGLFRSGN